MPLPAVQPAPSAALSYAFPCQVEHVRPAVSALRAFLHTHTVAEEDVGACELALTEACNNAVLNAKASARQQPVRVAALCGSDELELRVEDHTPGFVWPAQFTLPEAGSEHGRGLYLIHSLMDRVDYLIGSQSNCLVMTRRRRSVRLPASPAAASTPRAEVEQRLIEDERIIRDMAEELASCYESLSAIFRYGAEQSQVVNAQDFSRRLLDDLLKIIGADWYVFRLLDSLDSALAVFVASEPALYLDPLPVPGSEEPDACAELQSVLGRRDVWLEQPEAWRARDPLRAAGGEAVGLVHPVHIGATPVGTLAIGKRSPTFGFTAARVNVVQTLADFLAIQVVNSRLQQQRVQGLLVARELDIARRIQQSLLLDTLPTLPGLDLATYCESASQVGGDFCDVIELSETALLLVVSDVMGKGIPAAMFAVILRSLIRALRPLGQQPAVLLARLNHLLHGELSEVDMFITCQLACIDLRRAEIVLASAGHCPLALATITGQATVRWVSPEGVPLGVLPHAFYGEERITLPSQASALLYSDGLTEQTSPDAEFFGQERLGAWLARAAVSQRSAASLQEELVAELAAFRGGRALGDDQTFIIVRRKDPVSANPDEEDS